MEVAKVRSQFATFFSMPFCLFSTRGGEGLVEKVWREIVIIKTKRDSKLTIPREKTQRRAFFTHFYEWQERDVIQRSTWEKNSEGREVFIKDFG